MTEQHLIYKDMTFCWFPENGEPVFPDGISPCFRSLACWDNVGRVISLDGHDYEIEGVQLPGGTLISCADITDVSTLHRKNQLYEAVLNSSFDGIVVTGADGHNIFINDAYAKIIRCDPEYIRGKSVKELLQKGIIKTSPALTILKTKRPMSVMNYENGITTFVSSSPLFDRDGNVRAVVANVRDVSSIVTLYEMMDKSSRMEDAGNATPIIFRSEKMGDVVKTAAELATVSSNVLIQGETGTGKGVIAQFVHSNSSRKDKPFVSVNCAAIPENLFESEFFGYTSGAFTGANRQGKKGLLQAADEGTLFLDEIEGLPLLMQAKLLSVIQEKQFTPVGGIHPVKVDIRVITASNQDLKKMVAEKTFREDLFYRLNVVNITIPPLRSRPDDVMPLATYFLSKYNNQYGRNKYFIHEVLDAMTRYAWPGNVRELQNLVERLVVVGAQSIITLREMPDDFLEHVEDIRIYKNGKTLSAMEDEFYSRIINEAYQQYPSSYQLAEKLEISQSKANRLIQKYVTHRKPAQ